MRNFKVIGALACVAGALVMSAPSFAEDAMTAPGHKTIGKTEASKNEMIPSLAVLNSRGATLKDGVLTMSGISANSIVFADRPWRAAGHVLTSEFIKQWGEGKDSFAGDPPNATISVLSNDGQSVEDAVVELRMPKLQGDTLTFEVGVLEGKLEKADGPASLFIDWFAVHGGYGHVGVVGGVGYYHRPVWHGGWYGHPGAFVAGAAVGAAAASPYYGYPPPACGYYPYPPCY
jgi:hypothetical protein